MMGYREECGQKGHRRRPTLHSRLRKDLETFLATSDRADGVPRPGARSSVKTVGGEEPLLQRYRCLLCGCAGGKDVVVDPAHLVSGDHVRNLQAWPEKEGLVRAAAPEEDVGRWMTMIAQWIKKYGPGPYVWDYATSREGIKSKKGVRNPTKDEGRDVQVLGWFR